MQQLQLRIYSNQTFSNSLTGSRHWLK